MSDARSAMDAMYRRQRHIYDLTRKFYLLGRDELIAELNPPEGGAVLESSPVAQTLESFETLAEFRLEDGWVPRFQGAQDPDQQERCYSTSNTLKCLEILYS